MKDKKGLFEEANNGTIFLDEIGEMAFELQAKLLRLSLIHIYTFMKGPENYQNVDGKEVPVMHTGKSGVRVGRLNLTLKRK